jgi:hypothetical protein
MPSPVKVKADRSQKFLVEHISYSLLFVRQLSKRPQVNI